jgi:ubiquitin C
LYRIKNESIILLIKEQTINFKFLNEKWITLSYLPLNTIEYYKKLIYNKTLIIQENQRLIFKRMELDNNKTITEYNIEQTSIIYIIKRLESEAIYSNIFVKINWYLL